MPKPKMSAGEAIGYHDGAQRAQSERKVLSHLRIEPAEGGGHIVEHHFEHYAHEPERHVFGATEGDEAMAHIAKYAKIQVPKADVKES